LELRWPVSGPPTALHEIAIRKGISIKRRKSKFIFGAEKYRRLDIVSIQLCRYNGLNGDNRKEENLRTCKVSKEDSQSLALREEKK